MSTGTGALVDRVGVRLDADVSGHARLPLSAAIERNGHVLASPLMLAADIASGIRLHRPDVESVLTASFSFRRTDRRPLGAVTAAATRLWEHGRRVIDDVEYLDEAGEQVGFGRIAFTVLGRRDGGSDADGSDAAAFSRFMTPRVDPIDTPLIDAAGIELVDAAVGHARFRPEQDVGDRSVGDRGVAHRGVGRFEPRSGADIVQGSFVTLLGEAAALAFAEHELAAAVTVRSLEVGYLAPVAADTVTTRARWLGRRGAADIDVVACDVETGRVCATFVVGVTTV